MTIEQRLVKDCGYTEYPELATWLLTDGQLVNGSHEDHQRDIDHHEIGQYFKKSKFEDIGSSLIYILKFMRRGNIRLGCSAYGCYINFIKTPTREQYTVLKKIIWLTKRHGIDCLLVRTKTKTKEIKYTPEKFMAYAEKYIK